MSEFDQMLKESFKTIKTGEVIKGSIISVRDDSLVVNIGYKHDGLIAKSELTNDPAADLHELYKEGDEIEARVSKVNDGEGNVLLTMKKGFGERSFSQVINDAFENKTVLTAVVDEIVNKGLTVTVDGVKVFIPGSMVTDPYEGDLSKYLGQEINFLIYDYVPKKRRVIGDRKSLIVQERKAAMEHILENLHEGDVLEGTVKSVTEFGAFIDLGGADGLLHKTEMGWGRIGNPKKHYNVGDTVKVFVKSIKGDKIGLSKKFPDENPWVNAEEKFAVGTVVTGKIARLTDFGAFVNIEPGIDGLVHVSQITRDRVEKPSDVLTLGQEVTAKIIKFDPDEKRISLSIRAMLPAPERPDRPDRRRGNRAPREESFENEDGTVNIAKYIAKLDREEAAKAKAEAEEAAKEAAAEAVEEVKETAEAVQETAKEAVTEATETVTETAEAATEAAAEAVNEVKEEAAEAVEEAKETVAEAAEEVKKAVTEEA